jgi:hypothetical protein
MNKAELIETIYAERAMVADEQDRAEGGDLALLEGWEKALSWVVRQLNKEGEDTAMCGDHLVPLNSGCGCQL